MLNENPIETLKKYVNQPSGTFDVEDVTKVAEMFAEDFRSLGFETELLPGEKLGPKLRARIGTGEKQLMLMGHMDTVFPHAMWHPYEDRGDGTAQGSGINDMKGGVVVMLHALKNVLPKLELKKYRLCVLLNPDEEIGSPESHAVIFETAKESFAALSFEPSGSDGRLTCARKGVTSVLVQCTGIPGHSGVRYKECASAIQALCAQITKLYALRDDSRDISFNAGKISGGTAENVVAGTAECKCEFRYFDESLKPVIAEKIREICAAEPVPGVTTTLTFGASHPACDLNPKSQALLDKATKIAAEQGISVYHERTGGAGDISIVAQAGIGVLDGLGLRGSFAHCPNEDAILESLPERIALAGALLCAVCE